MPPSILFLPSPPFYVACSMAAHFHVPVSCHAHAPLVTSGSTGYNCLEARNRTFLPDCPSGMRVPCRVAQFCCATTSARSIAQSAEQRCALPWPPMLHRCAHPQCLAYTAPTPTSPQSGDSSFASRLALSITLVQNFSFCGPNSCKVRELDTRAACAAPHRCCTKKHLKPADLGRHVTDSGCCCSQPSLQCLGLQGTG